MLPLPIVCPDGPSPSYTGIDLDFSHTENGPAEPTADPDRVTVVFYSPKRPANATPTGGGDDDTTRIEGPFVVLVNLVLEAMGGEAGGVTVQQLTKSDSDDGGEEDDEEDEGILEDMGMDRGALISGSDGKQVDLFLSSAFSESATQFRRHRAARFQIVMHSYGGALSAEALCAAARAAFPFAPPQTAAAGAAAFRLSPSWEDTAEEWAKGLRCDSLPHVESEAPLSAPSCWRGAAGAPALLLKTVTGQDASSGGAHGPEISTRFTLYAVADPPAVGAGVGAGAEGASAAVLPAQVQQLQKQSGPKRPRVSPAGTTAAAGAAGGDAAGTASAAAAPPERREAIGCAVITYSNGEMGTFGPTLELLEVAPKWRRRGLGRRLLRAVEDFAHVATSPRSIDWPVTLSLCNATSSQSFWLGTGFVFTDPPLNEEGIKQLEHRSRCSCGACVGGLLSARFSCKLSHVAERDLVDEPACLRTLPPHLRHGGYTRPVLNGLKSCLRAIGLCAKNNLLPTPQTVAELWEQAHTQGGSSAGGAGGGGPKWREERAALLRAVGDDAVAQLVASVLDSVRHLDADHFFEESGFWDDADPQTVCDNDGNAAGVRIAALGDDFPEKLRGCCDCGLANSDDDDDEDEDGGFF